MATVKSSGTSMAAVNPGSGVGGSSDSKPKGKLGKFFEIAKFLYSNDFTRGIGRDILMFSASIVIIRVVMAGLAEELPPSAAAPLP